MSDIFDKLYEIATEAGKGSVERKVGGLADLLKTSDAKSARFLARIPVGNLRLGFSDLTVLDAISFAYVGDKSKRKEYEAAYHVRPDIGWLAKEIKNNKSRIGKPYPVVGTPILMARCERLNDAKTILEKAGTKVAVEPKFDGFRLQIHLKRAKEPKSQRAKSQMMTRDEKGELVPTQVRLFTRNLEDATFMYPDIVKGVLEQVKVDGAILEGEALAYDGATGEYLPFQQTTQRKRKYNIAEMAEKIPLKLFCFEVLFVDGKNLMDQGFATRRGELVKLIKEGDTLIVSSESLVDDPGKLEAIFQDAISRGLEGVVVKKLDGVYQAGARGFNWIKFKRGFAGKGLEDTIDCLVMGYDSGTGKRTGFGIGSLLIGVYDDKNDRFQSIAKLGTGLTDKEWVQIRKEIDKVRSDKMPARYEVDKLVGVDVWAKPKIIIVVKADEITKSPMHTAGRNSDIKLGYALRFPRMIEFGRKDKLPEDATTVSEIAKMFAGQKKVKLNGASEG